MWTWRKSSLSCTLFTLLHNCTTAPPKKRFQNCRYWACQSLLVKKGCTRFACPNYLVIHLIFQFITDHFLTHLRKFQDCRICSCYSLSVRNGAHVLLGPASRLLEHTLRLEQLYGCLVQPLYTCTPTGDLLWTNPWVVWEYLYFD